MNIKITDYFDRYPTSKEVYLSGGILFHNKGAAESFGKDEPKHYTRKQAEAYRAAEKETTTNEVKNKPSFTKNKK